MTTPGFSDAFAIVVSAEGGLSLDPDDKGNWTGGAVGRGDLKGTKYGISAAAFPYLDIANLTLADAQNIYRAKYWDANRCDEMPWPVNLVVFDAEVNSGSEGALALQHALGVKTDGDIGPVTLAAVKARDPVELAIEVMVSRDAFYHAIQQFATFGEGWIKRLFSVTWQAARAEN